MSLDRRTFIAQSTLAAAGVALCSCGSDSTGPTAPTTIGSSIKISDHPTLATVDGVALVTVNGSQLAIVRTGENSFIALSRVCPHQGGRIDPNGSGFKCTNHGAEFTRTGTWTGGQRTTNMRSYATTYDAETGTINIR